MPGVPKSAKNAQVRIGSATHFATSWDVNPSAEELETSNFEGVGYTDRIAGLIDCEVTVEGWFDTSANPFDSPLSLAAGNVITNLKLYLNTTAGPFWLFPSFQILTSPMTGVQVKGLLPFKFTGKNKGIFSAPTGSA